MFEQHRPGAATIRVFEGPLRKGAVANFTAVEMRDCELSHLSNQPEKGGNGACGK